LGDPAKQENPVSFSVFVSPRYFSLPDADLRRYDGVIENPGFAFGQVEFPQQNVRAIQFWL
jgi:hypothetical protein